MKRNAVAFDRVFSGSPRISDISILHKIIM